jgi:shikimate dehydrogenase
VILGDRPSQYAKSPAIWNSAFGALEINATYVPLDVPRDNLAQLVKTLRDIPEYVGGNVTVPYKVEILQYLDRLDPLAEAIGAVNTIVRGETGELVGYNTDGQGAVDALTKAQPRRPAPFMESLAGARVLLLGAGGAARAVAHYLSQQLGSGRLWIANRSHGRASELAMRLRGTGAVGRNFGDGRLGRSD